MRDRGVVTDPALNPNVSAAEGQSDGLKSPQPLEVPNPVDPETRRAMLRHMLMARGIDDEAGLLQNQGASTSGCRAAARRRHRSARRWRSAMKR